MTKVDHDKFFNFFYLYAQFYQLKYDNHIRLGNVVFFRDKYGFSPYYPGAYILVNDDDEILYGFAINKRDNYIYKGLDICLHPKVDIDGFD